MAIRKYKPTTPGRRGSSVSDFAEITRAFGIQAESIDRRDQVDDALRTMLAADGPWLLHVKIDPRANVWPLVPPNTPNHEMMEKQP